VKARPIAGVLALGHKFLARLEPWIYRRFLSRADITGIKALKRRIEKQTAHRGEGQRDVKTGKGGIRDIEFVIQFLQLLNGSDLPEVRTGNTIQAIARLENAGCLTPQERSILEPNYELLRKLEHRLQIMFDLQTHTLPSDDEELRRLAVRMGYDDQGGDGALKNFRTDLEECAATNRRILDHLLHDAFGDEPRSEPEVDLINDPSPSEEQIVEVLSKHGFTDLEAAYVNLMSLAAEPIRFLSTRRCRHFLASIAPRLLAAVAETPSPDSTLVTLSRVSDSLGGKSALWELFSFNQPSMNLYVTLCAACPYLVSILTSNPGMIDELVDSLLLEKLPTLEMLEAELADLCRGAEDVDPILHSFKDAQHLRVGVRDILGKDDIRATHAALADVAETCVRRIARVEYDGLAAKFGEPTIGPPKDQGETGTPGERVGQACELIILALGKLGGREPNYHSDLDLVFLFDAEGWTAHRGRTKGSTTTNGHFFSELGQRIIKRVSRMGPHGRLFEVDMRLRPTGKSGALALPIDAFLRYFTAGSGQLWERQSLCKARVIYGSERAAQAATDAVHHASFSGTWRPEQAQEIRQMRLRLEENASDRNLKRGPGGTVDTEFLVQMLQLKYGRADASVRRPGTIDALRALRAAGYLSDDDAEYFIRSYRFQRSIEARIRLMNAAARHNFPSDREELAKLAFLLGYSDPKQLEVEAREFFRENRERFDRLFEEHARG
jgi:glutamate-ammonia-ligase adenylyltransferase